MAPEASPTTEWVRVGTFFDMNQARLLAGRLHAEGIPAELDPPVVGDYYGEQAGVYFAHGIKVLVPEDRRLEARQLIDELERA